MLRTAIIRRFFPMLAAVACVAAVACASKSAPGEVVLVVSTDLGVPTDVDTLHVTVTRTGEDKPYFDESYYLGADSNAGLEPKQLPGTFALVASEQTHGVVRVHLELSQGKKGPIRVQRDAEVQVPTAGVKQLPMPLDYLCLDAGLHDACVAGTTCQAGRCVDDTGAPLSDYAPTPAGACFDAATCFGVINGGNSTLAQKHADLQGCSVTSSQALDATNVNVALVVNRAMVGNYGLCDESLGGCIVPLDHGPEGWQTLFDKVTGRPFGIGLPDAVCDVGGSVARVVITSSLGCGVKDASRPLCPAPPQCVSASGFCPDGWDGLSCSGSTGPGEKRGRYCAEASTDALTGPLVPGLWCCADQTKPDLVHRADKLIDDMSGGPGAKLKPPGDTKDGGWFTSTDDPSAVLSPPPYPALFTYRTIEPAVTPTIDGPTISHAACLRSDGFAGYYALEGLNFLVAPPDYKSSPPLDVSAYTGIQFWAYSAPPGQLDLPTAIRVQFSNVDTYGQSSDSTCAKHGGPATCDDFGKYVTLTSDWAPYTIHWSDLEQQGFPGAEPFPNGFVPNVYAINFVVLGPGPGSGSRALPFDFCIAQIEFTQ